MKYPTLIVTALMASACATAAPRAITTTQQDGVTVATNAKTASVPVTVTYNSILDAEAGVPYTVNFVVTPTTALPSLNVRLSSDHAMTGNVDNALVNVPAHVGIPLTVVVTPQEGQSVVSVNLSADYNGRVRQGVSAILLNTPSAVITQETGTLQKSQQGDEAPSEYVMDGGSL